MKKGFKAFFSFVKKESLHIARDKRTMLLVIVIPVVQMILFGFAISDEINNITFAISAPHLTEDIRKETDAISRNDYFTFYGYVDIRQTDDLLRQGKCDAVIQIDDRGNVHLAMDASNPNMAVAGSGYIQSILSSNSVASALFATRMIYNPQLKSSYNFVPGILGMIFLLICAIMTSVSIVREKESGTMEVLLVSPVRAISIVFAKMIPYLVLSCLDLAMILFLAGYVLEVPVMNSFGSIIAVTLLYIILSLALGLLVSSITSKQETAVLISGMVFILPTVLLSGMMFPVSNMPQVLQWLSTIIPARWFVDAIRKLMIEGLSLKDVIDNVSILFGMTVVLLAIALFKFKTRLE